MNMKTNWWKAIASFLVVLFTMPLGHAMMMIMEKTMTPVALHYSAFLMGLVGLFIVITGVFVKGATKQTIFGLIGGLLFWTGWVEFLFQYYATRWGTQPEIVNGEVVTKPEYLILPASFGMWMMMMTLYIFSTKNGCNFINWWQRRLLGSRKNEIAARPMTHHTSIVTFMELNMILWASYLLLMFCYDSNFLGDRHSDTIIVAAGCMLCSIFIFMKQLRLSSWGANIRMAIATVVVFWVPVEVLGRLDFFHEFWVEPQEYATQMTCILVAFLILLVYIVMAARKQKSKG